MSDEAAPPFSGSARYEVTRPLGKGGMGVVYEARDRERDTLVALKTLRRVGPAAIARFKREFRALADVVHPNLVSLYELVAEDDDLFITMELVRGVHFDRWAMGASYTDEVSTDERNGETDATRTMLKGDADGDATFRAPSLSPERPSATLDLARLRAGLQQLAEGVAAIHQAGMLHRDLKPSNVLVTDDGRVVVLDFGLITELAEESPLATEDRPLEGTFGYMSPEQGARAPLSPASDWYSVGVILYRLLTGRMPFLGGRDDVLMDKQRFEPPPPHELALGVPEDLDALCRELLRRQPERRPTEADILRRVGSRLARARPGASASLSGGSSQVAYDTLVGREAELGAIGRAYDRAKRGAPVLVRVHGPSGAGKSRLVRGFLDGLPAGDHALVLRGRCYEQESVPFKAVDSVVDALAGHLARQSALDVEGLMPRDAVALARLFPTLRQVETFTARRRRDVTAPDPLELRRRAFAALRELLARVADRQPLVVAIDDLQWGDVDSVTLLAALLREPDAPALLLVVTFRSEGREHNPFLAAFDEQVGRSRVAIEDVLVGPIPDADALRLALVHLGGAGDAAAAARIVAEAQGNPFLLEELARHARERASDGEHPVSLDDALRGRVLRLPRDAGRLLAIVAVAGRPIPHAVAMRAAGVDDPAVLALLKVASLVRTRSAGEHRFVEPYHDRVRETVVALQSPDELRELHLRVAESHEASPSPDPETLAVHYAAAGEHGRASELAMVAARRAAEALAFDRAASLYRMAVELATTPVDRRVYVALGNALASGGRGVESADAFLAALDGAPAAEALELRCRAAGQLLFSGHIDRGLATLNEVIGAVGLRPARTPGRALLSIGVNRLRLAVRGFRFREVDEREVPASQLVKLDVAFAAAEGLGMADPIRATAFQVRSLLLALKVGEPKRVVRALAAEIAFSSLRGVANAKPTARLQLMLDELAARLGDPDSRGMALGARAIAAFNEGRFVACGDSAGRAEEVFRDECTGLRWELATAQLFHGFALALTGRVRELLARFPVLIKEANERGDLYAATTMTACLGFYVPLAHDDPERAHAEVADAITRWSARTFQLPHANALNAHVCCDLYVGDGVRALARCDEAWPHVEKALLLRVQTMRAILSSIRARSMLSAIAQDGDASRLARVERIARKLDREGAPYCAAEAIMLRAGIAHHTGDTPRALALLAAAEDAYRDVDLVLSQYAARRARGVLLGGDEGAALVETADAPLVAQGVRRPDRVAEVFAPGFARTRKLLT